MPDKDEEKSEDSGVSASTNSQSSLLKKRVPKKRKMRKGPKKETASQAKGKLGAQAKYPRHPVDKALRVPRAILEQNAGRECSDKETAGYVGVTLVGPFQVEIGSALKYKFLERPTPGRLGLTDLGRKILRPHNPGDVIEGYRQAVLNAPEISAVYKHYRGENLPDQQFFDNALVDNFRIPASKLSEFKSVFLDSLRAAKLVEERDGKIRLLDVSQEIAYLGENSELKEA